MVSLHIEHAITDLDTWTAAFAVLSDGRRQMGVANETVRQPIDDPRYIVVDLEFDASEHAHAFLHFLRTNIGPTRPTRRPSPPHRRPGCCRRSS